jgi:hypothetical protein
MTESHCTYPGDRDEALIACLYGDAEGDRAARILFESHAVACARCREELAALRGVRRQLARWAPPEPTFAVAGRESAIRPPSSAIPGQHWWSEVPAWAQVAAALLFLGVSAGIANLDVRYDATGLSVHTGWSRPSRDARAGDPAPSSAVSPASAVTVAPATWRADFAALERQVHELRALQASLVPALVPAARPSSASDDVVRRVRALLDDSERRQKSELALRVAEVMRDVQTQRQADLVKIDRTLGAVQNSLGVEVMKDRQKLNTLLIRTSGVSRE